MDHGRARRYPRPRRELRPRSRLRRPLAGRNVTGGAPARPRSALHDHRPGSHARTLLRLAGGPDLRPARRRQHPQPRNAPGPETEPHVCILCRDASAAHGSKGRWSMVDGRWSMVDGRWSPTRRAGSSPRRGPARRCSTSPPLLHRGDDCRDAGVTLLRRRCRSRARPAPGGCRRAPGVRGDCGGR